MHQIDQDKVFLQAKINAEFLAKSITNPELLPELIKSVDLKLRSGPEPRTIVEELFEDSYRYSRLNTYIFTHNLIDI